MSLDPHHSASDPLRAGPIHVYRGGRAGGVSFAGGWTSDGIAPVHEGGSDAGKDPTPDSSTMSASGGPSGARGGSCGWGRLVIGRPLLRGTLTTQRPVAYRSSCSIMNALSSISWLTIARQEAAGVRAAPPAGRFGRLNRSRCKAGCRARALALPRGTRAGRRRRSRERAATGGLRRRSPLDVRRGTLLKGSAERWRGP